MNRINKIIILFLLANNIIFADTKFFPGIQDAHLIANIVSIYLTESFILDAYLYLMQVFSLLLYNNMLPIIILVVVLKYLSDSIKASLQGDPAIWGSWLWQSWTNNVIIRFFIMMIFAWSILQPVKVYKVAFNIIKDTDDTIISINVRNLPDDKQLNFKSLNKKLHISKKGDDLQKGIVDYSSVIPLIAIAPVMLYQRTVYGVPQNEKLPQTDTPVEKSSIIELPVMKRLLTNNISDAKAVVEDFLYVLKTPSLFLNVIKQFEGIPNEVVSYKAKMKSIYEKLKSINKNDKARIPLIISNHINKYLTLIQNNATKMADANSLNLTEYALKHLAVSLGGNTAEFPILTADRSDIQNALVARPGQSDSINFNDYIGKTFIVPSQGTGNTINQMFGSTYSHSESSTPASGAVPATKNQNTSSKNTSSSNKETDDSQFSNGVLETQHYFIKIDDTLPYYDFKKILGTEVYNKLGFKKWKDSAPIYADMILNTNLLSTSTAPSDDSSDNKVYPITIKGNSLEAKLLAQRQKRISGSFFEDKTLTKDGFYTKLREELITYITNKYNYMMLQIVLNYYYNDIKNLLMSAVYEGNIADDNDEITSGKVFGISTSDYKYNATDNKISDLITKKILMGINLKNSFVTVNQKNAIIEETKQLIKKVSSNTIKTDVYSRKLIKEIKKNGSDNLKEEINSNKAAFDEFNILGSNDNKTLYNYVVEKLTKYGFVDFSRNTVSKYTAKWQQEIDAYNDGLKNNVLKGADELEYILQVYKTSSAPWVPVSYINGIEDELKKEYDENEKALLVKIKSISSSSTSSVKDIIKANGISKTDLGIRQLWLNWLLNDNNISNFIKADVSFMSDLEKVITSNYNLFANIFYDYGSRKNIEEIMKKEASSRVMNADNFIEMIKAYFGEGAKDAPQIYDMTKSLIKVLGIFDQAVIFNINNNLVVSNPKKEILSPDDMKDLNQINDITKIGESYVKEHKDTVAKNKTGKEVEGSYLFQALMAFLNFIQNQIVVALSGFVFNILYVIGFVAFSSFLISVSIVYSFWLIYMYFKWSLNSVYQIMNTFVSKNPEWKELIENLWEQIKELYQAQAGPLLLSFITLAIFIIGNSLQSIFLLIFIKFQGIALVPTLFFVYVIISGVISAAFLKISFMVFTKSVGMSSFFVTGVQGLAKYAGYASKNLAKGAVTKTIKGVSSSVKTVKNVNKKTRETYKKTSQAISDFRKEDMAGKARMVKKGIAKGSIEGMKITGKAAVGGLKLVKNSALKTTEIATLGASAAIYKDASAVVDNVVKTYKETVKEHIIDMVKSNIENPESNGITGGNRLIDKLNSAVGTTMSGNENQDTLNSGNGTMQNITNHNIINLDKENLEKLLSNNSIGEFNKIKKDFQSILKQGDLNKDENKKVSSLLTIIQIKEKEKIKEEMEKLFKNNNIQTSNIILEFGYAKEDPKKLENFKKEDVELIINEIENLLKKDEIDKNLREELNEILSSAYKTKRKKHV